LILEWLTLWPTWGALAVSSQRRDIVEILSRPAHLAAAFGANGINVHFPGLERRRYRCDDLARQGLCPENASKNGHLTGRSGSQAAARIT
jgi:hypothetical protein